VKQPHPSLPVKDRLQKKSSLRFSLPDGAGSLSSALRWFELHGVNLTRLESRPSKRSTDYDFYVDFQGDSSDERVKQLMRDLRQNVRDLHVMEGRKVAWFPRRIKDLDLIANDILDAGEELTADHPGFSDPEYRKRRLQIAETAMQYRIGSPIPPVSYTPEEVGTWTAIWDQLMPLLQRHACAEHVRLLPLLMENCGYRRDNIPQIADISDFLHECTGFQMRPVAGLLSARNFLYGLAFRVFFSTQYLRHHSRPLYTPEPDLVHELMGHAPLFADQVSQTGCVTLQRSRQQPQQSSG
jgi:phenylalanine-4-hydroxylase